MHITYLPTLGCEKESFSGESAYGLPSYNPTQKSFLKWRKNVFSLVLK